MKISSFESAPTYFLAICFALTTAALCCPANTVADDDQPKRALDHKDYDQWNTLSGQSVSSDGKWVKYMISSGKADSDSTLVVRSLSSNKQFTIVRGSRSTFSFDGKYVVYQISPDPKLIKKLRKEKAKPEQMPSSKMEVLELKTGEHFTINRVKSFSMPRENGRWIAYLLEKPFDVNTVKQATSDVKETYEVTPAGLRLAKKPLKLKKRESLNPQEAEKKAAEKKKEEAKSKEKQTSAEKGTGDDGKKADKDKNKKATGTFLVLRDLDSGLERKFPDAASYTFSKNGATLVFASSVGYEAKKKPKAKKPKAKKDDGKKDGKDTEAADIDPVDGVYIFDLEDQELTQIAEGTGSYRGFAFNETGSQLAFVTTKDDYDSETSAWSLYHWKSGKKSATKIADESHESVPSSWWISSNATLRFSEDDRRLYFATAPLPEAVAKERSDAAKKAADKEVADEDDDEDKAKLDLWHWQDPLLQPQQLLQAASERRRDYRALYDLKSKKIFQLATREMPTVVVDHRSETDIAVGATNLPYRKSLSWDVQGFQDTYLVNLKTGKRELLLEKSRVNPRLSPEGKFVTWWDAEELKWFAMSTAKKSTGDETQREPVEISSGIGHALQNELHDTPSLPRPYGSAGWLKDDSAFLIYDKFDIWKLDPTGKADPVCLTEGVGRERSIQFRYQQLDREQRAIDLEQPMMLTAFNRETKAAGFFVRAAATKAKDSKNSSGSKSGNKESEDEKDGAEEDSSLKQLIMLDERFGRLTKAKNSDEVVFTRSTFERCPDLWSSSTAFKKISRISDINPQQENYSWGTAELVHWDATDGQKLDGLLYKPDGFDPEKKYPMMVYFYERNSDNLHAYYTPSAGRSIINHSFYVSRGYLLFVPDIPYKTGEPGPSAANAILPGVQSLVDLGFVDEEKIGMQGHSWGGYQTAYLVTQTDMFACAESGAPVSNMTSAYGGIRWSSGMSRMFQYERTQSRIGDDLWSARDKYIANSPLFFADKINTPLLILHNDEDGAVPWYQGIELFVAMRRLEKPSWLLNYNGNPHWVMGDANRRDFAIRMQQFFDHYLMDAPEPEWMAVGLPAVDKGKKFAIELLEPEKAEAEEGEESEEGEPVEK